MGEWSEAIDVRCLGSNEGAIHWQPGFFDHVLRNDESYGEKMGIRAGKPCSRQTSTAA